MVDTIDLCEDEDTVLASSFMPSATVSQCPRPIAIQPTLPTQSEPAPDHLGSNKASPSLPILGPYTMQSTEYSEAFYIDFITTIERAFPWQAFARRHGVSGNDLRHLFFVLVTLPLSDPDDNSKRLKVAQGARKRFWEWRQAWQETVTNIRAECSGDMTEREANVMSTT